jgi:hypothetical protein
MNGKRVALDLMVLIALLVAPLATSSAQTSADSYTSELTGAQIEIDSPWEIDPTGSYNHDGLEVVSISTGVQFLLLGFVPSWLEPNVVRDLLLDSIAAEADASETIDKGSYGAVNYSLDVVLLEGAPAGIFTLVQSGRYGEYHHVSMFFSPVLGFREGLQSAQESVTVDREGVFEGIDAQGLYDLLSGSGLASTAATPDVSNQELGLVEDGRYVSPQLGAEVTWDERWALDVLTGEPIASDTLLREDTLALDWTGGGLDMLVVIFGEGKGEGITREMLEWLLPAGPEGDDIEVLQTAMSEDALALIVQSPEDLGDDFFMVSEISCVDERCDTISVVTLVGSADSIAEAYEEAQDGVSIDGSPVFTVLTRADVEDAITR